MASGSQNMTTYLAKQIIGSNVAVNPEGALLQSGANRADNSATGDTWIFLNTVNSTTNPWGIFHSQVDNKIKIIGDGTDDFWVDMDTGDTYILGNLSTGSVLTVRAQDSIHEGGEIVLSPATGSFSTIHIDAYDSMFRLHDGTNERFKVNVSNGNTTVNGNLGIGTDYAVLGGSYKLYVGGTGYISTNLTVDGLINNYKFSTQSSLNADDIRTTNGCWIVNAAITNAPTANHGLLFGVASVGTPNQMFFPDNQLYVYKRWYSSDAWTAWNKMNAGYADSAGSCTGNAATATTAATATNANYLISNTRMDYGWNGVNYFNLSAARSATIKNNQTPYASATWTHILRFNHANNAGYYTDLAIPFNGNSVWYRRIANGALQNASYDSNTGWVELLDAINYTSYTVTKTGSGASGTWAISVTGNAATASYANVMNNDGGRRASSEYMHADGKLRFYLATSSMTTGKPPTGDGFILKGGWDNTGGWDALISWSNSGHMSVRGSSGGGNATNHTQTWRAWNTILDSDNYTSYTVTKTGGGASGSWGINITGSAGSAGYASSYLANRGSVSGSTHAVALQSYFNSYKSSEPRNALVAHYSSAYGNGSMCFGYFLSGYDSNPYGGFFVAHYNTAYYVGIQNGGYSQRKIWTQGDSVTSAVWNDYAEARKSLCTEPGRAVQETGSDTLVLVTKRLAPCAGIISDTWGFSQGETDSAKTHIAVAGRVLAYPYRDRTEYKPGDVLCAAPDGTVDIMTREEVRDYPDRIVGTVSCIPEYEEWGGGEGADRPPVKVNGRIWVKVK